MEQVASRLDTTYGQSVVYWLTTLPTTPKILPEKEGNLSLSLETLHVFSQLTRTWARL